MFKMRHEKFLYLLRRLSLIIYANSLINKLKQCIDYQAVLADIYEIFQLSRLKHFMALIIYTINLYIKSFFCHLVFFSRLYTCLLCHKFHNNTFSLNSGHKYYRKSPERILGMSLYKKRHFVLIGVMSGLLILSLILSAVLGGCASSDMNSRFDAYVEEVFRQEVSANTITLHYTLKDPESYGIQPSSVSCGYAGTDSALMCASAENALAGLRQFKRNMLSDNNKLTYDVLEHSFSSSLEIGPYLLYEEPLTPLTGTQAQLPILLSEYQFYHTADIDTYLELLTTVPEYFQSVLTFEEAKSDAGLFMASYTADDIISECQTFATMENNYLYTTFDSKVDALNLSATTSEDYKKRNRDAVLNYVLPAYTELGDGIQDLRDTGKNKRGLCHLPDGKKYYELSVKEQTGSARTIPELQTLTQKQIQSDLLAMQKLLNDSSFQNSSKDSYDSSQGTEPGADSDLFKGHGTEFPSDNPVNILNTLQDKISGSFPEPPKVSFEIKYVHDAMEEYLSPAFYMIPPIDNSGENVIYINQGHISDDLTLFTTLAHEGYPGHLYQTVYYSATDHPTIRDLLSFGGYTEGWATYCEMISYYYSPLERDMATLLQHNASVLLGLYALADMGIHYDGWTLAETVAFFRTYGITNEKTIEDIFDLIVADPGNYLKYYIGYVEFLELKKLAVKTWGKDFTQKRFHKCVLDAGPAPFEILQKQIKNAD